MSDDYLWDKRGEPDPEIERLESLLGAYASDGGAPVPVVPTHGRRRRLAAAAAVLAAAGVVVALWLGGREAPPRTQPGDAPYFAYETAGAGGTGRLAVGEALSTKAGERVQVHVADIGTVTLAERSRLALVATGADQHRMRLERGALHAVVNAPPRLFIVETPAAEAVDLGCEYTLEVDDDGSGMLRVATGRVALEREGRAVTVPYDASCTFHKGRGPGTPCFEDAPEALRAAVDAIDGGATDVRHLRTVLAEARKRDTLTLFHLLPRFEGRDRERIYDRMAVLVAPPRDTTREGTLALDPDMLEIWFDELRWEAFDPD